MRQFLEDLINMDVSIIIVNFNTDKLVRECVASVKKNTKKVKYEIIVIDNSVNNRGFAKANNIGISQAKGKCVLLLNSDTLVRPGAIDKLFEFAENNPDAGVVAPKLLNIDGTIQASCFRFPTIERAIQQFFLGKKGLLDKYVPTTETVDVAVMAAFLITPRALKEVGKLDEKYFMYFEDFDYCKRIQEAGLGVYYLPSAEVVHIHGASGAPNKYLVESSKKYFGNVQYYIYTFILWLGQKWEKLFK